MKSNFYVSLLLITVICSNIQVYSQVVSDFVTVSTPDDIEVDAHNNIWVNYEVSPNPPQYRLAKITPEGILTDVISENMVLGSFGVNDNFIWINGPWGEFGSSYKYDHSGNLIESIPMPYATAIILDPDGTWYLTQNAMIRLTKVFPNNTSQVLVSGAPLHLNLALARDENGMFYTNNLIDSKVIKMNPDTGEKTLLTTLPSTNPYSLGFCAYSNGYLYVPSARHVIYKVDVTDGSYTLFAGTDLTAGDANGDVMSARFNSPIALAFSNDGDTMYITDSGNNKIKKITGVNGLSLNEQTLTDNNVFIYNMPNGQGLKFKSSNESLSIVSINLFSLDGKLIEEFNPRTPSYIISTHHIQTGAYYAHINLSNNQSINKKVIIT